MMLSFATIFMRSPLTRRVFLCTTAALLAVFTAVGAADLSETHASVRAVMALQKEITHPLMQLENILGTAVAVEEDGQASLVIFVERDGPNTAAALRAIPPRLRG